ncbi:MAG: DUF5686 and carboxypeptidase regulatory-like domain-containing protein [Tannerellaceae bacterium]|jgi:hypothetical protein|nr:DUF5686 and carboxypeptidase regulatory-like domain-containing protein [Tannerellaceae bacterium]
MYKIFNYISQFFLFLFVAGATALQAQSFTSASGILRDSITGEPLSFVSVIFDKSTIGAMTDDMGRFALQNDKGFTRLVISSLGYETKVIELKPGSRNDGLDVRICPTSFELTEIVIKPKRERYSRKDNPAVELIREVIAHKGENRIESKDEYRVERYEKLSMSLDNFNPDFEKNKFMKKLNFIKNYIDTSEFSGKPILTLSVREAISDVYYRKSPKTQKIIVKGKQTEGIDQSVDEGGITSNLEEIFQGVDIFDNDINILLNRFVSPLSSALAVSYYKYYIMDTVDVSGDRCIDLAFVPVNSQSYGFTGRLYITMDGRYAVKKAVLNVPQHINLNFVDQLRIDQEFTCMPDSTWVLDTENTYINFYLFSRSQELYAHQLRTYQGYSFEVANRDSVFGLTGPLHFLPQATAQTDSFWIANRHIPLDEKESILNELLAELRKVPAINAIIKTAEILISGYIQTGPSREENLFDIGPMNTIFSANHLEGFRLRIGGMTTANLHPHLFASGYLAYGMDDRKFKYNARLTYSFNKKAYHESENPVNNLSFLHEYDVYTPGQDFLFTSKDNMFVAWKVGEPVTKMNYVRKYVLQYEKEWLNGFSFRTWARHQSEEAAGTLKYIYKDDLGNERSWRSIVSSELGVQFRFAPGERAYTGRSGKASPFNLSKDAPIFKLSHQAGFKGILNSNYTYNHTELSVEKRIWLSSFGHLDTRFKAGKVWDKAPFPLLALPNTNQSVTIQPEAFHMMRALEFVADQYVSLNVTYYMKGWLLNRIPGVRWLKFREVLSFNGIYGSLSDKNNPALSNQLFLFPEGTMGLGNKPYMEVSAGLENIFKILRIDYYRRLTYLDNPHIKKGGIRIALRFSF